MRYLVIDSGTTNSRVRLCDEKCVLQAIHRQVGAKDVSIAGNNNMLKVAIKECIEDVLNKSNINLDTVEAIIASGMISSNVGLAEVSHIPAPAGIKEISKGIQNIYFPEIVGKQITFIPGVKTGFNINTLLESKDIIRGEEAEIFGYIESGKEDNDEEILFIHYGSHHKCIKVKDGKITDCRTAITGELLMAVSQNTILKSSLMSVGEVEPLMVWVEEGVRIAETEGFGRALFSTRILDVMEKRTKQESTSFYLGALLSLDLELVSALITNKTKRIVLYGKKLFPSIAEEFIRNRYPWIEIVMIPEEESDLLSANGAIKIYKNALVRR